MELSADPVMRLWVEVGPGTRLGATPAGTTTVIPIVGGRVEGEGWQGSILPGGADWNSVDRGRTTFYARYNFVTNDGTLVTVINEGTTPSDFARSFIKTRTTFLVDADSPRAHLLDGVHVATLDVDEIDRGWVKIGVYRLR